MYSLILWLNSLKNKKCFQQHYFETINVPSFLKHNQQTLSSVFTCLIKMFFRINHLQKINNNLIGAMQWF